MRKELQIWKFISQIHIASFVCECDAIERQQRNYWQISISRQTFESRRTQPDRCETNWVDRSKTIQTESKFQCFIVNKKRSFKSNRFTRRSSPNVSFSSSSSIGRETLVSLSIFVLRSETATFAQSDHEINIPSSSLDNWADVEEDDDPKINRLQIDSRWCWSESVVLTQQMRRHRSMFMSEKLRRDAGRNDAVLSFLDEIVSSMRLILIWRVSMGENMWSTKSILIDLTTCLVETNRWRRISRWKRHTKPIWSDCWRVRRSD